MGEIVFESSSGKFIILAVIQALFIILTTFSNLISWMVGRVILTPNIIFKQLFLGLVLTQFINLVFTETFNLIVLAIGDWNLGKNVCTFSINVSMSSETMSSWLLALLLLDGYIKSRFSEQYKYWYKKRLTIISCVIWLGLFIIILPVNSVISVGAFHFDNTTNTWHCHLPQQVSTTIVNFFIDFLFPIILSMWLFINFKYYVKKNKIITQHLDKASPELTDDLSSVESNRPKTPWSTAWRDKIEEKINDGPNNTLPPICTIYPFMQKPAMISIKSQNEQKIDSNHITDYTAKINRKSSFSAADVTSLSNDGLQRFQRPSLPDIRDSLQFQSSTPVEAWHSIIQFHKQQNKAGVDNRPAKLDEVQSLHGNSNSGSPDDTSSNLLQLDVKKLGVELFQKSNELSLTDHDKATSTCDDNVREKYNGQLTSSEEKDTTESLKTISDENQHMVRRLNVKSVSLTDINDVHENGDCKKWESAQCDTNSIPCFTPNNRSNSLDNTQTTDHFTDKNKQIHHEKNKLRKKRRKGDGIYPKKEGRDSDNNSIDFEILDYQTSTTLRRKKSNVPYFLTKIKKAWFKKSITSSDYEMNEFYTDEYEENGHLINIYLVLIMIYQFLALPKVCLQFYLSSCSECTTDFIVLYCLNLIERIPQIVSPILIVYLHPPFNVIMMYFLSWFKCQCNKK